MKRYLQNNFSNLYKILAIFYRKFIFIKLKFSKANKKGIFTNIYKFDKWKANESKSGTGSTLEQTKNIRLLLPDLFHKLAIRTIIDCPCGDFNWMSKINLKDINYRGYDIVSEIISSNKRKFSKENISFKAIDITKDFFEAGDLIIMRDLLVHFSFDDIFKTLKNIKKSNSKFLLTTNFSKIESNYDVATGQWRPVNLLLPPFNFLKPILVLNELNTEYEDEKFKSKNLSLWSISDLP